MGNLVGDNKENNLHPKYFPGEVVEFIDDENGDHLVGTIDKVDTSINYARYDIKIHEGCTCLKIAEGLILRKLPFKSYLVNYYSLKCPLSPGMKPQDNVVSTIYTTNKGSIDVAKHFIEDHCIITKLEELD